MRNRQKLIDRNLSIIKHNLSVMDDFFQHHANLFSWIRPRAGSMAFPRYLGGDVESFCDELVRKAGVLLLPGSMYDEYANHFRLGLGRKNLSEAVIRLEEFLENSSVTSMQLISFPSCTLCSFVVKIKTMQRLITILRLSRPLYLLLTALMYILGAGIARFLGKPQVPTTFWLGLIGILFAQLSMNLLAEVFRPANEPIVLNETPN